MTSKDRFNSNRKKELALKEQGARWYTTNGVYVITTRSGEKISGMTAAWVTRVCEDPVLISVAIWEKNYTHNLLKQSEVFVVNILREGQTKVAIHFGKQSGRDINKFTGISFQEGKTGAPILDNCLGYLECKVVFSRKLGDHTIFVGKVLEEGIKKGGRALVYKHSDYF